VQLTLLTKTLNEDKMKKTFLTVALLASLSAQAQTSLSSQSQPLRGFIGMGVTAGGDDLATATYTNGRSADIKAGGGVVFTAGMDYRIGAQFSVQGSINFHVDNQTASNGDMRFQRYPVEVIGYFHPNEQWKVGGGIRYVSGAKLSSSGVASGIDARFKNTASAIFETEYLFAPSTGIKLRWVKEKFELKNGRGEVKGDHVGVLGAYYF
jgi:hypothetical protein